jgi:hypothetical protein
MQLREAEERELNQKKMYDGMFKAIEESNSGGQSARRHEDFLNNTQSSITREVEEM